MPAWRAVPLLVAAAVLPSSGCRWLMGHLGPDPRPGAASPARRCCVLCDDPETACPWEVAAGPSLGPMLYLPGGRGLSGHAGVEVAAGKRFFWMAAGVRVAFDQGFRGVLPYVEGGVVLGISIGVGAGALLGAGEAWAGPHLFVGLPLPVSRRWYLEPYYRPSLLFAVGTDVLRVASEVGVMVKLWTHRGRYGD